MAASSPATRRRERRRWSARRSSQRRHVGRPAGRDRGEHRDPVRPARSGRRSTALTCAVFSAAASVASAAPVAAAATPARTAAWRRAAAWLSDAVGDAGTDEATGTVDGDAAGMGGSGLGSGSVDRDRATGAHQRGQRDRVLAVLVAQRADRAVSAGLAAMAWSYVAIRAMRLGVQRAEWIDCAASAAVRRTVRWSAQPATASATAPAPERGGSATSATHRCATAATRGWSRHRASEHHPSVGSATRLRPVAACRITVRIGRPGTASATLPSGAPVERADAARYARDQPPLAHVPTGGKQCVFDRYRWRSYREVRDAISSASDARAPGRPWRRPSQSDRADRWPTSAISPRTGPGHGWSSRWSTAAGYDLEDLSVVRMGRRYVVRVTVDRDGGVAARRGRRPRPRDLGRARRGRGAGGEFIAGEYQLEVSSPGVDRPLTAAPALAAQRRPAGHGQGRRAAGDRPGRRGRRRQR